MRAASLIIASAAGIVGLVFPFVLGRQATGENQTILLVMMIGIAGAFIHGAGFRPTGRWGVALISPILTWPLILGGGAALVALR
jgi:predicted membrane protein